MGHVRLSRSLYRRQLRGQQQRDGRLYRRRYGCWSTGRQRYRLVREELRFHRRNIGRFPDSRLGRGRSRGAKDTRPGHHGRYNQPLRKRQPDTDRILPQRRDKDTLGRHVRGVLRERSRQGRKSGSSLSSPAETTGTVPVPLLTTTGWTARAPRRHWSTCTQYMPT